MNSSYKLKLDRASRHINECEVHFTDWLRDGYRIFERTNSKGRTELLAEMLKELPEEIPLSIGDAIHCLRDCLDHITFELAMSGSMTLTEEQERAIQFPISKTIVKVGDKRIAFMSGEAQKAIIGLLPNPTEDHFCNHPLWLLNKLNNRDKHRKISVVVASSGARSISIRASNGSDYFRTFAAARPTLGGGPVVFMEFERNPYVKADIKFETQIEFDEGTDVAGNQVIPWLRSIEKHIKDIVITTLEPFL